MHRAALQDLQKAVDLESTRELVTELRRAQEMLRACIRRAPKTPVPIKIMSSVELPPSPPTIPSLPSKADGRPSVEVEREDEKCREGEASLLVSTDWGAPSLVPPEELPTPPPPALHPKAEAPCRGLTTAKVPLVPRAPKSSYELQRHWRSLGNDPKVRASYLQQIKPGTLPKLITNHMEPELLADLVVALAEVEGGESRAPVSEWLMCLQQLSRIDMTVMLLTQKDKERISRALDELQSRHGSKAMASAVDSMRAKLGGKG